MARIVWSVAAAGAFALLVHFQPWTLRFPNLRNHIGPR